MLILHTIGQVREYTDSLRKQGKSIGFVPTMGALHQGHLSLVSEAKAQNDVVICSIFVNPIQFNNPQDLAVYPRMLEADCELLKTVNCEVVFAPSAQEIYPSPSVLRFDFGDLERVLEGKFRAGHFNGVGVVVAKLFHIVQPHRAYFGQKDLQQCLIVKRLVADLSFGLELHICPTLRETDGLAMSSRNRNLSPELRATAPLIFKTLTQAQLLLNTQTVEEVQGFVSKQFMNIEHITLEYFEVVDTTRLSSLSGHISQEEVALCIAVFYGNTRLIDNVTFIPKPY